MPIAQPMTFKCPKCGYKYTKMVGDVINLTDLFPTCPICGTKMKPTSSSVFDSIIDFFKNFKK